jgi:hypothetical protein
MTKRVAFWLLLVLGLGLVFYVPVARAGARLGPQTGSWYAEDGGNIQVTIRHVGLGKSQTGIVLYNQDWKAITEVQPSNGSVTFEHLKVGDYHIMAYADDLQDNLAQDVPVFAHQTTTVDMKLNKPVVATANYWNHQYATCGAAYGDGGNLKIFSTYDTRIIYVQCGHVVGSVGTGCSSCGRSGGWRYTTTCTKTTPVYVNLPCPRRHN